MRNSGNRIRALVGLLTVVLVGASASAVEWTGAEFISVAKAVNGEAEAKTAAFLKRVINRSAVRRAVWRTTALGVYEAYVNGKATEGFLKPGFTHVFKRRLETAADVTTMWNQAAGACNILAAEVTAGWWRDQITGFRGRDTGFRGVLVLDYEDGSEEMILTDGSWLSGYVSPVVEASIFDGEVFDARISREWMRSGEPPAGFGPSNVCRDYGGKVVPMGGKAVALREDLAMKPVAAYVWRGVTGANDQAYGKVCRVRDCLPDEPVVLAEGETLVVDFGQNAAAEPELVVRGTAGTTVTLLPAEMLNDGNGLRSRENDGPEGSVYRDNLHGAKARAVYVLSGRGDEGYMPRFSYFGFRYLSISADAEVTIKSLRSIPVSSVRREDETGRLVTGNCRLNRFIENVRWSHLSNYLSVPTDCPQRDERLGWCADAQVFARAALYLADGYRFLDGWLDDLVDSQHETGAFPSVAPLSQFGNEGNRIGWADAGIAVPWTLWKQTGDIRSAAAHWPAMMRFLRLVDRSKYRTTPGSFQYADWLSYEKFETCRDRLWSVLDPQILNWWGYLGACHWRQGALRMREMARAQGLAEDEAWCAESARRALDCLRAEFLDDDGRLPKAFRDLQSANAFALEAGIFTREDRRKESAAALVRSIREHGNCLQTGILGTAILPDVLVSIGEAKLAYTLLLQDRNPSWLYSVDQGATTTWERWDSYTTDGGFVGGGMNSFNHYSYGAVLAWMYSTMAGIRPDGQGAGFGHFTLGPVPDRRIGSVQCSYRTREGVVESSWCYQDDGSWKWTYVIPEGTTATVVTPDGRRAESGAGSFTVVLSGLN